MLFSYAKKQWALGRSIYGYKSWREKRRITLFVGRSYKNKKQLTELIEYFDTLICYHGMKVFMK